MIATTTSVLGRPLLIISILATSVWLVAQKGCVLTPDVTPKPVTFAIRGGEPALIQVHQSITQSSEPKSRSLKQASALLRHAADMLDKNDRRAVRLIRQAIAILKHEVIPGIDLPDHERVAMQSVPLLNEAFERKARIVNDQRPTNIDRGPMMMDHNGYRELAPAPPQSTCHAHGKPIDIESENALVETTGPLWRHDVAGTAWHQGCFNTLLGEGEET